MMYSQNNVGKFYYYGSNKEKPHEPIENSVYLVVKEANNYYRNTGPNAYLIFTTWIGAFIGDQIFTTTRICILVASKLYYQSVRNVEWSLE